MHRKWENLPNVYLHMLGDLRLRPDNVETKDETKKCHFEQYFDWRVDGESDEFVIKITRKPEAPRHGHTNVAVKIEGGLTEQPDGSVRFDGGAGKPGANGVSKFGISFEITHTDVTVVEPEEEPEEKEVKFFDHPDHKLLLAPENYCNNVVTGFVCDACWEPMTGAKGRWVYLCPNRECNYGVHVSCAQFPRTIRHPCHAKHALKLLALGAHASRNCDVCKGSIPHGLTYNCAKCDFDVHPVCPEEPNTSEASQVSSTWAATQARLDSQRQAQLDSQRQAQLDSQMQAQLFQQQQQMQLDQARRLAQMTIDAGRAVCDLAGDSRYSYVYRPF